MKTMHRALGVLACLALSTALAACGSESGDDDAANTSEKAAATPTAAAEKTKSGGGRTTVPGTKLKLGATAHVKLQPLNPPSSKQRFPMDVTIEKIEQGSQDDFKNVRLEAKLKQATPYYVTATIASTGAKAPKAIEDPDIRLSGLDDRGQDQRAVIFTGDFEPCDNQQPPGDFKGGKTYTTCLVFMVGGNGSIEQVQWKGADRYYTEPVVWK